MDNVFAYHLWKVEESRYHREENLGYIAEVLCLVQPSIQKINLRAGSGGDDGTVKKAVVQDPELLSRLESYIHHLHTDCVNLGKLLDVSVLVSLLKCGYLSLGYCEGKIMKAKTLVKFLSYSKSVVNISHFCYYYWALTLYFIDLYSVER